MQDTALQRQVEAALAQVLDPELGKSIVDLGLIYGVVKRQNTVHVTMTTTSRGCPAADFLVDAVRERVHAAIGHNNVEVELTYDPPWSPAMMRIKA